jgi:D-alanine-D-alanine ligase-like ATP-grasp enzyme
MSTPTTKSDACLWCGNNPTSHVAAKIDSGVFLVLNPIMQWVLSSVIARPIMLFIDGGFHTLVTLGQWMGFVRYEPMLPPYDFDRSGVMANEAHRCGIKMEQLVVGKRHQEVFRLTIAGKRLVFSGVPRLDRVEKVRSGWIDDKWLLKERLRTNNVPVSKGQVVYTKRGALQAYASLQKPVIVKPRFGSRGRHTTTHINTEAELITAFRRARMMAWPILIEEHLEGSVYRATCINGKVVGILAGDPPRITGDGVATIAALIEQKNATRDPRQGPVRFTDKLTTFLTSLGYTIESVLPVGKTIDLSEKIGLSYGGMSREMIDVTHPKLITMFERAAAAVADPILGFDFISTDVTVDPDTVRWGVIECNSVPFINLHHDPLEGTPADAAGALFDYLETEMGKDHARHTRAWWLFAAAALFFAFIPLLWYVPLFTEPEPVLFGRVLSVDGETMVVRMKQAEAITVVATTSTAPLFTENLVGERIMFTLDGVRDEKKEVVSLEVLPERGRP